MAQGFVPGSGSSSGNRHALCTSRPARHKRTNPSRRHHPDCDGGSVRGGEKPRAGPLPHPGGRGGLPGGSYPSAGRDRQSLSTGLVQGRAHSRHSAVSFMDETRVYPGGERMQAGAPTYTNTRRRDRRDPTEGQRATAREAGRAEVTRKPSPASRALGRTPATTPGSVLGRAGGAKRPGPAGPRGSRGTASVGGG